MEVLYPRCAGIDVHKKTAVVCVITPKTEGGFERQVRTFTTLTVGLLAMLDWFVECGCSHVAMESTGEYWRPIYNILEGNVEVLLVNARHLKTVPGRKTDVKDAEWIAQLLQHGLLQASFIPPPEQRILRDFTRHRLNFIRERVNLVNRVQKVLEGANIKLASVASDIMGVSGRAMLAALLEGTQTPAEMADLAKGQLRFKRDPLEQALTGRVDAHHRFILSELLCQIDAVEETIARFDAQIEAQCRPFEAAVERLDTIPGIARRAAEVIVAEIGIDMSRFPSAAHLASWAGLVPGNHESAGKQRSGRTRKGNQTLRTLLIQVAYAAGRTQTYLGAQFRRLAARRGRKRAAVAVGHSILVIAYHLIQRGEVYQDLGAHYFESQPPEKTKQHLVKRLQQLGYQVTLQPLPSPLAS
jgi:transposase